MQQVYELRYIYIIYSHIAVDFGGLQRKFSFIYVLSVPRACCCTMYVTK